jgi:hypothetical protein
MEDKKKTIAIADIQGSIDLTDICASTCPFLATKFDGITPMAYPNPKNHCFRHGQAVETTVEFQRAYCLSPKYETCPVFLKTETPRTRPQDSKKEAKDDGQRRLAVPVAAIILLLIFVTVISWPVLAQSPGQDQAVNLPTAFDQVWGLFENGAEAVNGEKITPPPGGGEALPDADIQQPVRKASGDFRAIQYPPG